MKELYLEPEVEVIALQAEDVIATSETAGSDNGSSEGDDF